METSNLPRRLKACAGCRDKRVACCVGDKEDCCLRCQRKGLECMPGPAEVKAREAREARNANDHSELRSQLTRFDAVLRAIQKQAGDKASPIASSSCDTPRCQTPSGDSPTSQTVPAESIEVNDLVGALTQLCFCPDGIVGGPKSKMNNNELIAAAIDMLSKQDTDSVASLAEGGFTFEPLPAQLSLQDVIAALPSETKCFYLLDGVYSAGWPTGLDGLFWPTWPIKIRSMYKSNFSPAPHPSELAELFAVLAIACSSLLVARDFEQFADERKKWQAHVDRYAELVQRALVLGNYVEKPTFEAARALCLLAELHLCCSSSTSKLARGLGILPIAFSILDTLGFHAPESDFEGEETPEQQYNRRALVCTLLRVDWTYNHAYGRRATSDPRTWRVEPPSRARDEDLPPEARPTCWHLSEVIMHGVRQRYYIARLQQEIVAEVFSDTRHVDYELVKRYAAQIDALWRETVLPDWEFYDDPQTTLRRWGDRRNPDKKLSHDDHISRGFCMPKLLKLVLSLHRAFVHPDATSVNTAVDVAWHRSVVLNTCRSFTLVYEEAYSLLGPFLSMLSSAFDAIVGICVLIFSNPESPEVAKHRHELSTAISAMITSPAAPAVVFKLGRIATFLLDRPRVRQAEQLAKQKGGEPCSKRVRKGVFSDGGYDPVGNRPSPTSLGTETFDFHFASMVPVPSMPSPAPSLPLPAPYEDDLWHKPLCTATAFPKPAKRALEPFGPVNPPVVPADLVPSDARRVATLPVRPPPPPVTLSMPASATFYDADDSLNEAIRAAGASLALPSGLESLAAEDARSSLADTFSPPMPEDVAFAPFSIDDDLETWLKQLAG